MIVLTFRIEEICFLIKNVVSNNTYVVIAGVTAGFAIHFLDDVLDHSSLRQVPNE